MQELLSFIVTAIVRHPEDVVVTQVESEDSQHITLRLTVHPEDMGLIIGKGGNIARSLRSIVKAKAIKNSQKVYIDIIEAGSTSNTDIEAETESEAIDDTDE